MNIVKNVVISLVVVITAIWIYDNVYRESPVDNTRFKQHSTEPHIEYVGNRQFIKAGNADLTHAASQALPAVVYVRSITDVSYDGWRTSYASSSGSGVIISPDGYIVTNKHLIENGSDIEVVLHDKRKFYAELVGTDEETDLALLKIEASDLPILEFANSDEIQVGQWVIAVGNPFKLHSTVTAGIVSAIARDLPQSGALHNHTAYIQTDAVVNKGNSGGALVNAAGKLIGINSAILTHSGQYEGYSFALPSNTVLKIVEDLQKYGIVHRGELGIEGITVNAELAYAKNLSTVRGIYVDNTLAHGAADVAGIKSGDIILKFNDSAVNTIAQLNQALSMHRPGDTVIIKIFRNQSYHKLKVILKNHLNTTTIESIPPSSTFSDIGIKVRNLNSGEKQKVKAGIKVISIREGSKIARTKMDPGFIITKVNDRDISDISSLKEALADLQGRIIIEGKYEDYEGAFWYVFYK